MDFIRNRIKMAVDTLGVLRYSHRKPVDHMNISKGDYDFGERLSREKMKAFSWQAYGRDETWGGTDAHYWFWTEIVPGRELEGKEVRAIVSTGDTDLWNTDNPQIMVYVDGKLSGTMDMNHQELILTEGKRPGDKYELAFYAYSNNSANTNFFHVDIAAYEENVAQLYYDMKVPFEAADLLDDEDLERIETWKVLSECAGMVDFRRPYSQSFYESVEKAGDYLREHYYTTKDRNREKAGGVTVHSIGHTHIDVAWKWPLRQTRQKVVRSFQTVLNLMERYPEYKFMSSQPQLYEYIKEEAPELFERIKEKVREGRWEAEGAAWLEPDCNLSSGESLIRHIMYGKKFFEEELGAEPSQVLWLPDVFGYSGAMPQILKKSGLSYFMTTKISWNEYNQFPYDTFMWTGIDGSQVLAYLITTKNYQKEGKDLHDDFNTTYNGRQNVSQIMGTWQRYQNKDLSKDVLTCFGYGDGGGGPTEEMLEESRRMEYGPGRCPRTRQTFVKEFFHILEETMDKKRLPVWNGELYLEFHRGTYTSMGKNKWYNRKSEFLCQDMEFYSVMAMESGGRFCYPKREIEENWKLLLLNQFHDILPGSCIKEVYEDSEVQYEKLLVSGRKLVEKAKEEVLKSSGLERDGHNILVWNPLSFSRTGIISLEQKAEGSRYLWQQAADGSYLYLAEDVPSKGYRVFTDENMKNGETEGLNGAVMTIVSAGENGVPEQIRTPYYDITFNSYGEMTGIYDRREGRELLKAGERGNRILIFEDRPLEFDAWNIDPTYKEKWWEFEEPQEFRVLENGPVRGCIYIRRKFLDSVMEQHIYVYKHTARIDFKTDMDWHEHQMLVKVFFPLDIFCDSASYEIQFGNVKRPTHYNTSWDRARFETCGHKWADMSEDGYGAALLNDCKYGYDIHDSVMSLTLLKSGIFPNPEADQGSHSFTYGLFPHQGDFRRGHVMEEAYDLNCPMEGTWVRGTGKESFSFLQIRESNVFADTVKRSEKEDGIIVRLYEAYGRRTKVHMTVPWAEGRRIMECGCMEDEWTDMGICRGETEFEMKPYEIKTMKIKNV